MVFCTLTCIFNRTHHKVLVEECARPFRCLSHFCGIVLYSMATLRLEAFLFNFVMIAMIWSPNDVFVTPLRLYTSKHHLVSNARAPHPLCWAASPMKSRTTKVRHHTDRPTRRTPNASHMQMFKPNKKEHAASPGFYPTPPPPPQIVDDETAYGVEEGERGPGVGS